MEAMFWVEILKQAKAGDKEAIQTLQQENAARTKLQKPSIEEELKALADSVRINIGIDPEILAIGTEMAVYHLEKGTRKFADYATAMIADLGDAIRPYLKAFYNGARNLPEVENTDIARDMTSYDEVQNFDVTNFDKPVIDAIATAETITRETEVANEIEAAQKSPQKTRSVKKGINNNSITPQQSYNLFDNKLITTMDYRELMQYAPKDCQPTIVDTEKNYQEALKRVAKENNKNVEELTSEEKKQAMGSIGLCDLDFLIP